MLTSLYYIFYKTKTLQNFRFLRPLNRNLLQCSQSDKYCKRKRQSSEGTDDISSKKIKNDEKEEKVVPLKRRFLRSHSESDISIMQAVDISCK